MAIQHKGGVLDYPENYSIGISSSTHASLCARYSLSLAFIGDKEPMGCQIVSERYHQEFPQGQKLLSENILRWTWISWPSGRTYLKVPPKKNNQIIPEKLEHFSSICFAGFAGYCRWWCGKCWPHEDFAAVLTIGKITRAPEPTNDTLTRLFLAKLWAALF